MEYAKFIACFSLPRVNRYFISTGHSEVRTIRLYKANLFVAQAFHPLLGIVEVVLRNKINSVLSIYFKDVDWIISQKKGFMIDPTLTFMYKRTGKKRTDHFLLNEVEKAEKRLLKNGALPTSGKIIAEQTFGFWTNLFEVHIYKLLLGKPIQAFSYLPKGYGRKEVLEELDKIRRFRNRINHNEPICFVGNTIDFAFTLQVHQSIINILSWIDPDLLIMIHDIDFVKETIESSEKI